MSPAHADLAASVRARLLNVAKAVPQVTPSGLTTAFADDASRQALWQAFLRKNELASEPLSAVVQRLQAALTPALMRAAS